MATGYFGKIPAAGDFVARGLGPGVRPVLDRWLTQNLAIPARTPEAWPDTGLTALIESPAGALALTILPSHDAAGRRFPLAACCATALSDQLGIDVWAGAVLPALKQAKDGEFGPDTLFEALQATPDPASAEMPLTAPLLWAKGVPTEPGQSLRDLFGSP